ncbi:MAG: TadA family conjugal transfer-associated ATPase [Actinomycetota bacterium]
MGLQENVRQILARTGHPVTTDSVSAAVSQCGAVVGHHDLLTLTRAVRADLMGLGPLDPLLDDEAVTDILVNGDQGAWIDRGKGLEPAGIDVGGVEAVRALACRLATNAGRRLDHASPFVDARLPQGVRLHAALPPVVEGGPHISLRIPSRRRLSMAALEKAGSFPPSWSVMLRHIVRSQCSFIITGGTGTGKTTLLGALLALVPVDARMVLVEDCAELAIDHPHVVRLEARRPNSEGRGEIAMTTLVRQALRMRPDRLVVGEVRGGEVREMLTALNTGHEGGCATVHANNAQELTPRLEALGALAGLPRDAIHAQLAGAIRVVIHLRRVAGRRRVMQVAVVQRTAMGVEVVPALMADSSDPRHPGSPGPGLETLSNWVQGE